jgi:PleD family two-component response regulator
VSGLAVLKVIRQLYSAAELPVIMSTAQGHSDDVVEALRLGISDYLTNAVRLFDGLGAHPYAVMLKPSVDRIARLEQSLAQPYAELEPANWSMRHDLEAVLPSWRSGGCA